MAVNTDIQNPYVGPQPFEQEDQNRFFGREREANELLSLVIANRISLLYAQSGAGKTSLLNAKLSPLLREREFDVLPLARVRGLIPNNISPEDVPNPYIFNALISWADDESDIEEFLHQSIAGYLSQRHRPTDSEGLAAPRIIIFDQFEELFTAYPDRWRDRRVFFKQVVEALQGGPLFFRSEDIQKPAELLSVLKNDDNPLSAYLRPRFTAEMRQMLAKVDSKRSGDQSYSDQLAYELNRLIRRRGLFRKNLTAEAAIIAQTEVLLDDSSGEDHSSNLNRLIRANNVANGETLKGMHFSDDVESLIQRNTRGEEVLKLNRMLLEEAYPKHLPKTSLGDPLLRVLFVIREDFIAQLDPYLPDLPNQLRSRLRLMRLQQRAALEAVKKPLQGTHRSFGEGVAEHLVDELLKINVETELGDVVSLKGEYVEPVQLQVVCENLWSDLPDEVQTITTSHVKEFGDVNDALATFYESTIASTVAASKIPEGVLRRFFERTLLTPAGTRGTVYRGVEETGGISNEAIDVLEDRHIIRGEWRGGSRWYELTHDRFIEPIKRANKKWLEKNIGGREVLHWLESKADRWHKKEQDKSALLDEIQLQRAERWINSPAAQAFEIPQVVRDLLSESRKQVDAVIIERERSLARRYRRFLLGIGLLLIPAGILWAISIINYQSVQQQVKAAEDSVKVFREAQALAILQRNEAILERVRADEKMAEAEALKKVAEDSLAAVREKINSANSLLADAQYELEEAVALKEDVEDQAQLAIDREEKAQQAYVQANRERIRAETGQVQAVRLLNQSLSLAIADRAKRQLRLGNNASAALLAKQAYAFDVESNNLFHSQVYDALRQTLNGLDTDSTKQLGGPQTLFDHRGQVRSVAYSPDGKWLASAGDDDFVRVQNLRTGTYLTLGTGRINVRCLDFNRESNLLAVCKQDGFLELWRFAPGEASPSKTTAPSVIARDAMFGDEGNTLVIIGSDGSIHRWTSTNEGIYKSIPLHNGTAFNTMASNSNSDLLVAADLTGRLHLWENWENNASKYLTSIQSSHVVNTIAFSPTDSSFATGGGDDYIIRVWKIGRNATITRTDSLPGHLGPVNDLVYSKDGALLASASSDQTIQVRRTREFSRQPLILQDHEFWVLSVDFSADGKRVASGSADGTVKVWVTSSQELADEVCNLLPGAQLTEKQWNAFIGSNIRINKYQKPCP